MVKSADRVILAHLSDDEIDQYLSPIELKPITKATITRSEVLRKELHEIRAGALGRCDEELHEGITAIASPVFDLYRRVVASIVLPIPTIRFTNEKEREAENILRIASIELSHKLGFDELKGAGDRKSL